MKTIYGYDNYEVMSALQKSVRRAKEVDAMFWAFELIDSGFFHIALSRLRVIAHEDIGIGDMQTVMFALRALDDTKDWYTKKNGAWRLSLTNAIMALCRSGVTGARHTKSREGDNLQGLVCGKRAQGWRLEMPDYALDCHTLRGKRKGRDEEYSSQPGRSYMIVPENKEDPYQEEADKLFIAFDKAKKDMYVQPQKNKKNISKDTNITDYEDQENEVERVGSK